MNEIYERFQWIAAETKAPSPASIMSADCNTANNNDRRIETE